MSQLVNITSTGQKIGPSEASPHNWGRGRLFGVVVNNHSSGTLRLVDSPNGASGRPLLGNASNPFTFPAGDGVYTFPEPIDFTEGVYAEIGGTLDCDLIYQPTGGQL